MHLGLFLIFISVILCGGHGDSSSFDYAEDSEEVARPNYAIDPDNAIRLAFIEENLIFKLQKINNGQHISDDCSKGLQKYIAEYSADTEAFLNKTGKHRAILVAENPLLLFKMLKRLVVTLISDTFTDCGDEYDTIRNTTEETFRENGIELPSHTDFDDAILGLLRIHYIYGLNATKDLYLGILAGVDTKTRLYFDDCLILGAVAVEHQVVNLAAQWLKAAELTSPIPGTTNEQLTENRAVLNKAWQEISRITGNYDSEELANGLIRTKQLAWFFGYASYKRYAVCRGEGKLSDENLKNTRCYFDQSRHPYFVVNPLRVEVLSKDPPVYQFYNIISDKHIRAMRKASRGSIMRSGVISAIQERTIFDPSRTSMNGWIYDSEERPTDINLKRLAVLTEMITGLHVYKEGASQFQVVKYGSIGGHYDFHLDSIQGSTAPIQDGDRLATFFMFMSDVKLGGFTGFPEIGTAARPVKGSAVLWYNVKSDGSPDENSLHGGCPVIMGVKEGANRWIMENVNVLKHKYTR